MATKVHMEALSPTMEEGRLVKWTKHEGDAVKSGDTLAEVETDKAIMELVARADGQLIKVVVPEGSTVPVGNVVAWIGKPGEKVDGAGSTEQGAGAPKAAAPAAAAAAPRTAPRTPPPPPPSAQTRAAPVNAPADTTRVKASPLARRIANDAGVDLKLVQGSGPGGRVIKRDVEAGAAQVQHAVPAPRSVLPAPSGAPYEDVPLTQIRKTIAKRLAASLGPVPHFFLTTEIDMERAAEARDALNKQLGEEGEGGGGGGGGRWGRGGRKRGGGVGRQDFVQRHHHQSGRVGVGAPPRVQRLVPGRPHSVLERSAHRHGGRHRRRPR